MPFARAFVWKLLVLTSSSILLSCSDDPADAGPLPAEIRLLSPAAQSGTPGWPLSQAIVVEVVDADGNALAGVPIRWTASIPGTRLSPAANATNTAGRAEAVWTLGLDEGQQTLSISAGALEPVTVIATASILHAAYVTLGGGFACALVDGGRAYCWGMNLQGQLGNGTVGNPVTIPAPVAGDLVFTTLTASSSHVCGLVAGGEAYCWGGSDAGETGTGSFTQSVATPTPVQTALRFSHISAEGTSNWSNSTCGLTAAGEAWCWGFNGLGKLGDGTTTNSAVPVRVVSDVPFGYLHTGYFHSCATAAVSGELLCWGEQETNTGAFGARPEGIYSTPIVVHPEFRFSQLSTGRNYTCALTAQHTAYCWGANWFGSLGTDPPTSASATPLPVAGSLSFSGLSAAGFEGTHGLTMEGVLYRWGSPGGDIAQNTPVPAGSIRFTQFDSGEEPFYFSNGSCGITTTGAVYCVRADDVVLGVPAIAER